MYRAPTGNVMIFNAEVFQITVLSLQISALATGLSLFIGLPLGTLLALGKFPGRSFLLSMVNTGMGLPPVVVGLFVAMMLWRSGPLNPGPMISTADQSPKGSWVRRPRRVSLERFSSRGLLAQWAKKAPS